MESTNKAHALLPGVSNKGRSACMFDDMTVNLLSVRQLCENGCTVAFMPTKAHVIKNNRVIMSAPQKKTMACGYIILKKWRG